MRILEIIKEYSETDIRIKRRPQSFDYTSLKRAQNRSDPNFDPDWHDATASEMPSNIRDKSTKDLGDPNAPGWYSRGQTNPRDPHEFVKKPHLTAILDKDAYYRYVVEINKLKKSGYTNPYFPQVYNVDITQDRKGNQRPRYRIEKLQTGQDYSEQALIGLHDRLFNREYQGPEKIDAIWRAIGYHIRRATESEQYENIRDDNLTEALMFIVQLVKENPKWNVDLHDNNFRIRGTAQGPQLVLMDPISDGGASIPDKDDILYGPERRSQRPAPKQKEDWSSFKNFAMGRK